MASLPRLPATLTALGVCGLVFLLTVVQAGSGDLGWLWSGFRPSLLVELGALALPEVWLGGQWWRLASAVFLHGSALHLGLNMVALWSVGAWLERAVGCWLWWLLFCLSGLAGCLASLAWVDGWLVVGASGAIFGLAGSLLAIRVFGDVKQRQQLQPVEPRSLGFWLVAWLVIGAAASALEWLPLAQGGHVGGLMAGLFGGLALARGRRGLARVGAGVGLCVVIAALVVFSRGEARPHQRALALGYGFLGTDQAAAAVPHLVSARAADSGSPGLANDLAYALALSGEQLELAAALADEALSADPTNADYLDTAGWVACRSGEFETGVAWLERALALDESGGSETIREHLAACRPVEEVRE